MSEYKKMVSEIQKMREAAERVRAQEIKAVIEKIQGMMAEYDLMPEDLRRGRARRSGAVIAPKYRDPSTGNTWTGRGKPPRWLVEAESAGKKRESFLISDAKAAPGKAPAKKAPAKKK